MKWVVLSIFTFIFWVCLYLYFYLGVSKNVEVSEFTSPAQLLVYKDHLGAYHKINNTILEVEAEIKKMGLLCTQTFGLFLDDPKVVDEDRLNSKAGCIYEGPTEAILDRTQGSTLKTQILPERRTVRADFSGSPAIGPMKVYPKIEEFIQIHRLGRSGPMLEIYTIQGESVSTTYLQPVN